LYSAAGRPEALEPTPKRRIDDDTVLLGAREVSVVDMIAALLTELRHEAVRVADAPVTAVALTHPAAWGPRRRDILAQAAVRAGFDRPQLVPEPVAAAVHLSRLISVPAGEHLVIYDFGAGTFDVSVLRRTTTGFDVLASEGLPDAGGLDIDAAVMAHLGATCSPRDAQAWNRLTNPMDTASRRANRQLWDDVRRAKELLSRAPSTSVYVPLLDVEVPLGREQLEQLAQPVVARTVSATIAILRDVGLSERQLAAVVLVGGASRMPLASSMLHRALGIPPTTVEHPELVVAEGRLSAIDTAPGPQPPTATVPPPSPVVPRPPAPAAAPAAPRQRRRRHRLVALAVVVLLVAVAAVAVVRFTNLLGGSPAGPVCGGKRIGVLTQSSGSWATLGGQLHDGAQRALDEYNRQHASCPVAMPVYDAQGSIAEALSDTSLIGIVGPLLSADVDSHGPAIDRAGLPMITPSATNANLDTHGWATFHRIIAGDADQGKAASHYLTATVHARRVYVLDDGGSYGQGTAKQAQLGLGANAVGAGTLPSDPQQRAHLLNQVAAAKPDAIYFGGFPTSLPDLLHTLHTLGIRVPVVGPDALHDPTLPQRAGTDGDALYVTCLCTRTPPPSFGTDPVQAYAYDAANILLAGVASGAATRAQMLDYLKHARIKGVMGDYQFRDNGELANTKVAILSIKQGAFADTATIPVD
jgi:ABC-type branched-subunit amino acid transport system substrate-binding protein